MFFIVREEDHAAVLYVSVRFYETQSHSQMYSLENHEEISVYSTSYPEAILSHAPSPTMLHHSSRH